LLLVKPVFPHVVSTGEIALREILLLEESWAKAHTDWHHFLLYENDLKIKKINLIQKTLNFVSIQ
jgi:hypothetical protein